MKKNSDVSVLFLTLKVISGIIFFTDSLAEELIYQTIDKDLLMETF